MCFLTDFLDLDLFMIFDFLFFVVRFLFFNLNNAFCNSLHDSSFSVICVQFKNSSIANPNFLSHLLPGLPFFRFTTVLLLFEIALLIPLLLLRFLELVTILGAFLCCFLFTGRLLGDTIFLC